MHDWDQKRANYSFTLSKLRLANRNTSINSTTNERQKSNKNEANIQANFFIFPLNWLDLSL